MKKYLITTSKMNQNNAKKKEEKQKLEQQQQQSWELLRNFSRQSVIPVKEVIIKCKREKTNMNNYDEQQQQQQPQNQKYQIITRNHVDQQNQQQQLQQQEKEDEINQKSAGIEGNLVSTTNWDGIWSSSGSTSGSNFLSSSESESNVDFVSSISCDFGDTQCQQPAGLNKENGQGYRPTKHRNVEEKEYPLLLSDSSYSSELTYDEEFDSISLSTGRKSSTLPHNRIVCRSI